MGEPAFQTPSSVLVNQDSMDKTARKGGLQISEYWIILQIYELFLRLLEYLENIANL